MDTQRCQNYGPVRLLLPLLEFNHTLALFFVPLLPLPQLRQAKLRVSDPSQFSKF